MRLVAITQRVAVDPNHGERRDCLDQRWAAFLNACHATPIPLPNAPEVAVSILDSVPLAGLVLTGGNDLAVYGGDAPERDETENRLLDRATQRGLPVIAVCRGMQLIQHRRGVPLRKVDGHVARRQTIRIEGKDAEVNSYHRFGTAENRPPLEPWAYSTDGLVKAVRDSERRTLALMWHPERLDPFALRDIELFRSFLGLPA